MDKVSCPEKIMESSSDRGCDCPLDCNEIKYAHHIQTESFQRTAFCDAELKSSNSTYMNSPDGEDMVKYLDDPFGLNDYAKNKATSKKNKCLERTMRGFQIEISYESSTGQKIIKMKRVTFAGMLSSLGEFAGNNSVMNASILKVLLTDFRWNYRAILRNEHSQPGRTRLLAPHSGRQRLQRGQNGEQKSVAPLDEDAINIAPFLHHA